MSWKKHPRKTIRINMPLVDPYQDISFSYLFANFNDDGILQGPSFSSEVEKVLESL